LSGEIHLLLGLSRPKQYRNPQISLAQEKETEIFSSRWWGNIYFSSYD